MTVQNEGQDKLRIGWVGCGFIGQVAHLLNFVEIPGVEIVALADLRPELGNMVCQRYDIPRFYENHLSLLEDPEVEAVVAIVKRQHTATVALDVLNAGRHLFTEKPMAATREQAERLVAAAKERQLCYSVGFMRRHDEGVQIAKRLLDEARESGELGPILYVRAYCFAGADYCNISGAIRTDEPPPAHTILPVAPDWLPERLHPDYDHFLNVFSHDINLLRFLIGSRPRVSHVQYRRAAGGVVTLDFGDFSGTLEFCEIEQDRWVEGVEIWFARGHLLLELPPAFLRNQPARVQLYKEDSRGPGHTIISNPDWTWSFRREDEAFVHDVLNSREPIASGADCIEDLILIEEIWRHLV